MKIFRSSFANLTKFAAVTTLFIAASLWVFGFDAPAYADRYSPPEESVRGKDEQAELEAEVKRLKDEMAERERRVAEARRRAAAANKKKVDRQKELEAKKLAEEERIRAAEEARRRRLESGRALLENGRYRSALGVLQAFAKENPHSADAWYWIARAHHALGDYDRAQTATNIALEIDPYYPALTKSPSGIQPNPRLTKQQRKEPRPSMSVLPVKPPLPAGLALEPVVISFPRLIQDKSGSKGGSSVPGSAGGDDGYAAGDDCASRADASGAYLRYDPYPPMERGRSVAWQQSEKFQEISRWRFRVDRMGILNEPRVPIAWKGSHPYEVYFWTGSEWARARRQRAAFEWVETYDDILAHAQSAITQVLAERGYEWNESDTPSLAANASLFRYMWIGDVDLSAAHARAEKRAREHFVYDSWNELDYQHGGDDRDSGSADGCDNSNDGDGGWGDDDGGDDSGGDSPSDNW